MGKKVIFRSIAALSTAIAIAGIVYYAWHGISWVVHRNSGVDQVSVSGSGLAQQNFIGNLSVSTSGPVQSNENVIPITNADSARSPQNSVTQINNPGCPDYLGDQFACLQ